MSTVRRLFVLSCTVAAAALVASPARAGLFERLNPFVSFESRCATLPPGHYEVLAVPVAFQEDFGESLRALSSMHEAAQLNHRTVGLTQARLSYESTLESKGLEERWGGRVCARPHVRVVFAAVPMTVYVARELAGDDCRREMIREHEMRHVAVYRTYLEEIVDRARRELPAVYGSEPVYSRNARESQEQMRVRLQDFMRSFMKTAYAELRERQARIDTSEEYARLGRACLMPAG